MAIIYSYPAITDPQLTDLLLVTDVSSSDPKNQTKTMTLQQVADLVDDEVTLQEVLNASDPGVTPPTASATGNIVLSGNITLTNLAVNGTSNFVGVATFATVDINGGNIDNTTIGGTVAAPGSFTNLKANDAEIGNVAALTGNPDLKVGNSIKFGGGIGTQNAFTIGSEYDGVGGNPSDFNGPYIQFGSGAAAGMSAVVQGTGSLTLSRASGVLNTGDIVIGGNSTVQLGITATATGGLVDVTAAEGISLLNTTSQDVSIQNSAPLGVIDLISGAGITLNSGTGTDDGVKLRGVNVGSYIKVQKGSAGTINEGQPVYISGFSGGTILVEAAANVSAATMPVVGIATTNITQGLSPSPTGEMIISGTHKFAVGTVINPGNPNDPIYVGAAGNLQTNRPTSGIVQVVGRVLNNTVTNDEIYVNCVGYAPSVNDLDFPVNAALVGDANQNATSTNGILNVDVAGTQTTLAFGARYNTDAGTGTGLGTTNANIQFGREAMAQVYGAGTHTTSGLNLAIGNEALMGNVGVGAVCSGNTAIGWQAMKLQDMSNALLTNNVAIGPGALRGAALSAAGLGGDNVAIGSLAMDSTTATTARRNVAIGSNALTNQTTSESNTAMGYNVGGSVVTGQDNVLIGSAADLTADHSGSTGVGRNIRVAEGALALGHNANANVSGSIALGAGAVATNPTINLTVTGAPAPAGGLPLYADNTAALAGGLVEGDVYAIPVPPGTPGFGTGAHVMAIVVP